MISLFSYLSGSSNRPLKLWLSGGTKVSSNKSIKRQQGKCHDESRCNGGGNRRTRSRPGSGAAALSGSVDIGGAAASPPARRHQGRIRSSRSRRHQFGAGALAL